MTRPVALAALLALARCGGDAPATSVAPVEPPASAQEALALGLTLADVTVSARLDERLVRVSGDATVRMERWRAEAARARAPASATAPTGPLTLHLHLAVTQVRADTTAVRVVTNAFDDRPARATFVGGRRLLVVAEADALEAGGWRVWHAFAVSPAGALAEPALGLAAGTPVAQALAP